MSSAFRYQPHYSVDDYIQWPGDWELWYGTAVAMSPSPFGPHERVVSRLVRQIGEQIEQFDCPCEIYAGLDWIVSNDTVVRPDVMIVCGDQPERHLEVPPSLVVEVLSDSTASKDQDAKLQLYLSQRVPVYVIVNPLTQQVDSYVLRNEGYEEQIDLNEVQATLPMGCEITIIKSRLFA